MDAKGLVKEYYTSEVFMKSAVIDKYMHPDMLLQWHSSKGYLELDRNDLRALAAELEKSYSASRLYISYVIAEGDNVCVRYTHYVNAIENPSEEVVLAHFVVIWEVKDGLLYKGSLMSQLG